MRYYADAQRHLVCVPYSVENLHIMATDLGIKRHWYHSSSKHKHYDIPVKLLDDILGDARVTVVSIRDILKICKGELNDV